MYTYTLFIYVYLVSNMSYTVHMHRTSSISCCIIVVTMSMVLNFTGKVFNTTGHTRCMRKRYAISPFRNATSDTTYDTRMIK
jgi:hypothetical protein